MEKNNVCKICGAPCRVKYCKECSKEVHKQYVKDYYKKRGKRKPKYQGCDEDCGHCPYPDCLKPVAQMKPAREVASVREIENPTSQGKMYTTSFGGYSSCSPNPRRKYYF